MQAGRSPGAWSRGAVWGVGWAGEGWGCWSVSSQPHLTHGVVSKGQGHPKGMLSLPTAVLSPLALAGPTPLCVLDPCGCKQSQANVEPITQPAPATASPILAPEPLASLHFCFYLLFSSFLAPPIKNGPPWVCGEALTLPLLCAHPLPVDSSRSWPEPPRSPQKRKVQGPRCPEAV